LTRFSENRPNFVTNVGRFKYNSLHADSFQPKIEDSMTHLSIDRQPDAVKAFFESLTLTPEGSVVEMNGQAVARVLPAEVEAPHDVSEWAPKLNHRRCDLIDKKFADGLTPAEERELATLTAGMRRFIDRVAPLPLEHVRKLHQELLEKAEAAEAQP